jgi:hypothetical protein
MEGKSITVGSIISNTFATLLGNLRAVALFLAVFVVAGSGADAMSGSPSPELAIVGGLLALLILLGSIFGSYLLMEAMLRQAGHLREATTRRFLQYLGQGILIGVGILAGMALLIVPGVIFAARWVIAPPLLIGAGDGAIEAIGKSWRLTKGHTLKILLAAFPVIILLIIAIAAAAFAIGSEGVAAIIIENFATQAFTVLTTAMAVALFGMINPHASEISEVFA